MYLKSAFKFNQEMLFLACSLVAETIGQMSMSFI